MEKTQHFGWLVEGDRIVIKRVNEETISPGGIIIPDTAKEKPLKGHIICIGPDVLNDESGLPKENCSFFIGQLVQFGKYAGQEITGDDGMEYIIIRVHDIMAFRPKGHTENITSDLS